MHIVVSIYMYVAAPFGCPFLYGFPKENQEDVSRRAAWLIALYPWSSPCPIGQWHLSSLGGSPWAFVKSPKELQRHGFGVQGSTLELFATSSLPFLDFLLFG